MQRYKEKNQRKEEEMYRVVTMYGTDEPWWFFDGWKEDIVSVDEFDDFYKALKYYKKEWFQLELHLFLHDLFPDKNSQWILVGYNVSPTSHYFYQYPYQKQLLHKSPESDPF